MISLDDVRAARDRIAAVTRHTPLVHSRSFSERTGAEVWLKLENLQRTGAFKVRGAMNRIETLDETAREAGVVTASAGNHAQGVALAATRAGVDATVVMPEHAPVSKVRATREYGARVVLHGEDYDAAQKRAHEIEAAEGRTYVHAFDDPYVMAGQGTIGLEVLEDCPDLDTVVVPVGGGGLIAGIATAITTQKPEARVVGVEAAGAAKLGASLAAGEPRTIDRADTIADGIATRRVGDRTFPVIEERVDEVVSVSDDDIALALVDLLERTKTLAEGAGAVPLAAVLSGAFDYDEGETIVPAICGGNIDLNVLATLIGRGLAETGRYLRFRTVLPDRPGALLGLTTVIAEHDANISAIHHDRTSRDVALDDAEVEIAVRTRGPDHAADLLDALEEAGYGTEVLD